MGCVAVFQLVVPQTELALDGWILTGTAIFSLAGCKVSTLESLSSPYVPIMDMLGGTSVGDVGVNARIHACISEADVRPHDPIFEGLSVTGLG
jgi:hypothetical protein